MESSPQDICLIESRGRLVTARRTTVWPLYWGWAAPAAANIQASATITAEPSYFWWPLCLMVIWLSSSSSSPSCEIRGTTTLAGWLVSLSDSVKPNGRPKVTSWFFWRVRSTCVCVCVCTHGEEEVRQWQQILAPRKEWDWLILFYGPCRQAVSKVKKKRGKLREQKKNGRRINMNPSRAC